MYLILFKFIIQTHAYILKNAEAWKVMKLKLIEINTGFYLFKVVEAEVVAALHCFRGQRGVN